MIIGITGKKRHGKNQTAEFYAEALDGDVEVFAYADPLKEMALGSPGYVEVFSGEGGTLAEVVRDYGWEEAKDEFPLVRATLQWLGTEVVRSVKETHWIDLAREHARQAVRDGKHVIITDIRFQNEADLIWELGGVVVKVERPSLEDDETSSHASEKGVEAIQADIDILNDGTLDDLRARVIDSLA